MATKLSTGKTGEQLGAVFLQEKGFQLIAANWRFSHWEVDIIASRQSVLHFIEIKTRRSKFFGNPEEKVGNKKIENLINAAEAYLYQYPQWQRIQFDILAILLLKNSPPDFFMIEDVYR